MLLKLKKTLFYKWELAIQESERGLFMIQWKGCFSSVQSLRRVWLFAAKSLQSCPTLCDPIDGGPAGAPVPGILQTRTLDWVAISFSNAWKWKVKVKSLSRVRLLETPWSAAHQAPLSMGFSRQEYWNGVPLPSPKDSTFFKFWLRWVLVTAYGIFDLACGMWDL